MKLKPILYMLVIFALFVSACGAETGTDETGNDNGAITNENFNGVTNENFNENLNANLNTNGNLNGNANDNLNANTNDNFNGAATTSPEATGVLPGTGATPGATTPPKATTGAGATPMATTAPQATTGAGAPMATATPGILGTPSAGGVLPNTGLPAQSQRAEIRGQREQLVTLSGLIGYQLVSASGQPIGTVSDYIINTCETFIVYMVVDPVSGVGPGGRFLVPFEAVTINSGAIDAGARNIVINMTPEQFAQIPAFQATGLADIQWEGPVRAFYDPLVRVSNLSTECRVQGGPTYKVAYASELLQAQLRDGNGQVLGTVREAILEPESGSMDFFVVELTPPGQGGTAPAQGQGQGQGLGQGRLVLVPLAAVNIPEEAYTQSGQICLVLLTDTNMLMNAPVLTFMEEAYSFDVQNTARQFWGQPLREPGTFNTPGQQIVPGSQPGGNDNGNANDSGTGNGNINGSGTGNANSNDNGGGYGTP